MSGRVYMPADILQVVKDHAASKLGVRPFQLSLKATDLGQIKVDVLELGKPVGPFFRLDLGAIKVADRIDHDGMVILECPFHLRGEYPTRMSEADFLKSHAVQLRTVRAEFLRLAVPFPPRGWEKLCGISAKIALGLLKRKGHE